MPVQVNSGVVPIAVRAMNIIQLLRSNRRDPSTVSPPALQAASDAGDAAAKSGRRAMVPNNLPIHLLPSQPPLLYKHS
jgi:hypothetical protein